MHLTEIECNYKWYIQALEFMGEQVSQASLDDESTDLDNDDDTQSIHPIIFQVTSKGYLRSSTARSQVSHVPMTSLSYRFSLRICPTLRPVLLLYGYLYHKSLDSLFLTFLVLDRHPFHGCHTLALHTLESHIGSLIMYMYLFHGCLPPMPIILESIKGPPL